MTNPAVPSQNSDPLFEVPPPAIRAKDTTSAPMAGPPYQRDLGALSASARGAGVQPDEAGGAGVVGSLFASTCGASSRAADGTGPRTDGGGFARAAVWHTQTQGAGGGQFAGEPAFRIAATTMTAPTGLDAARGMPREKAGKHWPLAAVSALSTGQLSGIGLVRLGATNVGAAGSR